ncbi:MAG: DEAD/DEAH box helicase [Thermoclostridium sp.]|nr:DEAD/DEAH box helicase [Thermoclostridium sp.]
MEKIKFKELPLAPELLKAVEEMGFEEATAIQTQAIPLILEGKDLIGLSQTGTGKTAAFGLPAIERINPAEKGVRVLILCPTRELAIQAAEEIKKFGKYKKGLKAVPIYGGQPIDRQIKALNQGVHIVIGTPGRVMDHMERKTISMSSVEMVVLDEADEMLNMGFREDMETILKDVPEMRQTLLFSATMSPEIMAITREYLKSPVTIKANHKQLTVPSIEQYYFEVAPVRKLEALTRLVDYYNPRLSLVFCNTKRRVDELVSELQLRGYLAEGLHGDLGQPARDRVMGMFRNGRIDILVATDVAARGIDVDDIEIVFNYDIPQDEEYYVHRIGRTGRAGKTGKAFTFVTGRREFYAIKDIQRYANTKIFPRTIPSQNDIEESKTSRFLDKVRQLMEDPELDRYSTMVEQLMDEEYTSMDVAAALMKMVLSDQKENHEKENEQEEHYADSGAEEGMVRLFINVGRKDGIQVRDIVGSIAGETGIQGKVIGKIDMYDKFTFVEVPVENQKEVLAAMKLAQIKGKRINIEPAKGKK